MQNIDRLHSGAILTDADVERLEKEMLVLPQADCPVIHRFSPGIYIREVTLPAGIFAIGHYQKTEHLNVMLKGKVTMLREDGTHDTVEAPLMYTGKPGRKMGWVHEETVWLNIYPTSETDVEKLEEMFLDQSLTWKHHREATLALEKLDHRFDRADFYLALADLEVPFAQVVEESERTEDLIAFPPGSYKCAVFESPIDGKGLFATAAIAPDEIIAPARISDKRTPAGRYTNHGVTPNAKMVFLSSSDVRLVALKEIAGSRGGSPGEEILIDYRQAYRENRGELPCQV